MHGRDGGAEVEIADRAQHEVDQVRGEHVAYDEPRSCRDQPKRKRTYAQIQRLIREEAPTVFLFTQNDTLGVSKKVEYTARADEWLWLFDAKPKK